MSEDTVVTADADHHSGSNLKALRHNKSLRRFTLRG